tara:strand:- start:511 stop:945 length:435 start_codon:yes stop_codon:yes gene_type:complete
MEKLETNSERLNRMFKENGLVRADIFDDKRGFSIIKREGIEKIIAKRNIQMQLEMKLCNLGVKDVDDSVVIMATGKMGSTIIQSFGSANDKTTSPFQKGIMVEMAEKRAKSRVTLQLAGFYSEGIYGEDEFAETKPINKLDLAK